MNDQSSEELAKDQGIELLPQFAASLFEQANSLV
jgi:hypothetical protein